MSDAIQQAAVAAAQRIVTKRQSTVSASVGKPADTAYRGSEEWLNALPSRSDKVRNASRDPFVKPWMK
jgi:hypothetical protein